MIKPFLSDDVLSALLTDLLSVGHETWDPAEAVEDDAVALYFAILDLRAARDRLSELERRIARIADIAGRP